MGEDFDRRPRSGPFSRVYGPWAEEWQRLRVTGAERGVLDALCSVLRFEADGRAYASRPRGEIARLCGRSEVAVKQLVRSLTQKGVLAVKDKACRGRAATYWVMPGLPWPAATGKVAEPMPRPGFEEVRDFFSQSGLSADPHRFFAHYEEVGWVTKGGEPVTDWRRLALAWEHRERRGGRSPERAQATGAKAPEATGVSDIMAAHGLSQDEAELALMTGTITC